ncbi:MAG: type 4a pilus biogenesis protein PilO [Panacagrimonas sp.]
MTFQDAIRDLQTLDVQNPSVWPTWVHIAAAALTALALIGVGVWFKLMPMNDELKAAERQESELFSEFERKQKKVVALDEYKAQLEEMERTFGAMLKQLPSRSEVANLLNDISQSRVASSLEEELFQPQTEQPKEFYAEIPNRIVVVGDYHEMGAFVSAVAALPRIVTVEDVDIRAAGRSREVSLNPNELRMTAVIKTYRYLDEAELEAAEAKKKPAKRGRRR